MEDSFQHALKIGLLNQETIRLFLNWCSHANIERHPADGVGLYEIQTGLPIGMRHIRCAHAETPSIGSMNMEHVALDFYDKNCKYCKYRSPKDIPNFSEIIDRRDREVQKRLDKKTARDTEAAQALSSRNIYRDNLAREKTPIVKAGIKVIGIFDAEPSAENGDHMLETLRAISEGHETLRHALHAIVDAGGTSRATYALEALRLCDDDVAPLVNAACAALGRRQALEIASQVVADLLSSETDTNLVDGALCGLITRAVPPRFSVKEDPSCLDGLRKAVSVFPEISIEHFRRSLRNQSYQVRMEALAALDRLNTSAPRLLKELAPSILQSLYLPDDEFKAQGATAIASKVLAYALAVEFDGVHAEIQKHYTSLDDEVRSHLVESYASAYLLSLNSDSTRLGDICLSTLFSIAFSRAYDKAFEESIRMLEIVARKGFMPQSAMPRLLGLLALMDDDYDESGGSALDPRPTPFQSFDVFERKSIISFGINHVINVIQESSYSNILEDIDVTIATLPLSRWRLRGYLVLAAKGAQKTVGTRALIPFIYRNLMHADSFTRKCAISLYEDMCRKKITHTLPDQLHQCFVVLIGDPYVIVHKEAVKTLGNVELPKAYALQAFEHVWAWAQHYATENKNDEDFCFDCMYVIHKMLEYDEVIISHEAAHSRMLSWAESLSPDASYRVLKRFFSSLLRLRQLAGFILKLSADRRLNNQNRNNIIESFHTLDLSVIPSSQIRTWIDQIIKVDLTPYSFFVIAESLTRAGNWELAQAMLGLASGKYQEDSSERAAKKAINDLATFIGAEQLIAAGNRKGAADSLEVILRDSIEIEGSLVDSGSNMPQDFRPRGFMLRMKHSAVYRVRSESYTKLHQAVSAISRGEWRDVDLNIASPFQTKFGESLGHSVSAHKYKVWLSLVEIVGLLLKWAAKARVADDSAGRFLQAAHMRIDELDFSLVSDLSGKSLANAASHLRAASTLKDVLSAASELLMVPLPVPLYSFSDDRNDPVGHQGDVRARAPHVAIVSFSVNGNPALYPTIVQPDVLYELSIQVSLSKWPAGATELVLEPLGVAPVDTWTLPPFTIRNNGKTKALHGTGLMRLHVAQSFGTEPLKFVYSGRFICPDGDEPVFVEGARDLFFRSYDPATAPVTGYEQADLKLMEILDELRRFPGVGIGELAAFSEVMKTLAQKAACSLQDGIFKKCESEADFQHDMRRYLRENPNIGSDLEEHPRAAGGGIVDLSFKRVRIELKYEEGVIVTVDHTLRYSEQAAQYVSGSDRRLGILCVLDNAPRATATGSVQNDIFLKVIPPSTGGTVPLLLGVVIVRGTLPNPSSLSKKAPKKKASS